MFRKIKDLYQTGMKQSPKFYPIGAYRLQKYIHTYIVKDVARGAGLAAAPPWHVTAPLSGGGKDSKLTKKRGKHEKKMIKD